MYDKWARVPELDGRWIRFRKNNLYVTLGKVGTAGEQRYCEQHGLKMLFHRASDTAAAFFSATEEQKDIMASVYLLTGEWT